jgi:tryptophanyl-tRNA synthetase
MEQTEAENSQSISNAEDEPSKKGAIVYEADLPNLFKNRRPRILSGMRPTGKLHIGHWAGALESWVGMQAIADNFFFVADYHALTTNLDSSKITSLSLEMVTDWIAFGLNPETSPIFRQSQVKEHTELFLILSMLITKSRLERNPAVKDQARDLGIGDQLISFGHLGYPVLMAADILLYQADLVPVGEDQVPHVEITREFARRFNEHYKTAKGEVFTVPKGYLTKYARLPGLDGKRMSKSLGNTIFLSDTEDDTWKKMKSAVTDPAKVRKGDPGTPEICLVFTYHNKWNESEVEEIRTGCSTGALGCVDCKKRATEKMNAFLAPGREKRTELSSTPNVVLNILKQGEERAKVAAESTMTEVREAMQFG